MKQARWPGRLLFGILLIVAVAAAWDYIEVRRFAGELARIEAVGEPTSLDRLNSPTREEESPASRYYRAASVMVFHDQSHSDQSRFNARVGLAAMSNDWPDELLAEMRRQVSANEEALRYLDKAASLEFTGFPETTHYQTRHYDLFDLHRVARLRTMLLAVEGKGDEAALSLYSSLRLQRTTEFRTLDRAAHAARRSDAVANIYLAQQLPMLVRTQPLANNLALLAEGFAALDDDDLLFHDLVWFRASARHPENPFWWRSGNLDRPLLLHQTNRGLRDFARVIAAQAGQAWPQKLDALAALDGELPRALTEHAHSVARDLALIRSARTILAVERYRNANAERIPDRWDALSGIQAPLIDPFSGQPLKILQNGAGYVVYSVGTNRRDDGGRNVTVPPPPAGRQRAERTLDVGISVSLN